MSFTDYLAKCLSLLTGKTVYPSKSRVPPNVHAAEFTLDFYAKLLFDNGKIGQVRETGDMTVYVQLIDGKKVPIQCDLNEPIFNFKTKLEQKTGLEAIEQNLMFDKKPLTDGKCLKDYGITNGSTIYYVLKLRSNAVNHYYLGSILDLNWNYDFRGHDDTGKKFYRGGLEYTRPVGCMRNALAVTGKYDGGNNNWLGQNNNSGEWCVSYNGSNTENVHEIVTWGQRLGMNAAGSPIFCTPNFHLALKHSDVLTDPQTGKKYKLIFQNRTDPSRIRRASEVGGPEDFWYLQNSYSSRAYAICVFQMN